MSWKINIPTEIKIAVALIGMMVLIGFSERKQRSVVIKDVVVSLDNLNENHFLDEADIAKLVQREGQKLAGKRADEINLREIENKLMYDKHILNAELYSDLKGNLVVNVEMRRPVARIVQSDAPDAYIAEDGVIMPVSEKYTSRVVLVSGHVKGLLESQNLNKTEEGKQLLRMIEFVNDDKFWKAQVAQLDLSANGKVTIYPQMTGQRVEFGRADDIENKFRKLMIFYKRILPQRGWTKYERVNLEYAGQIIAE